MVRPLPVWELTLKTTTMMVGRIFCSTPCLTRLRPFPKHRGEFEDVSEETGITRITMQYSGWGMKFFDYDHDGWKDVFVAQGHVLDTISIDFPNIPYKQRLLMMRNREASLKMFGPEWPGLP